MDTPNRRLLPALLTIALLAGCATALPPAATRTGTEVALDSGRVAGVADGEVLRFRGLPFAAPPLGELRWAPPQPVTPWEGVRPAKESGSRCPQPAAMGSTTPVGAEDCLYLDVTVPAAETVRPRPVMVWLHGGGFVSGTGSDVDARRLAVTGDVVVVSVEFRLGTLANLALPGMTDGGSYHLQDQQAALRWVRRNAAAFGADPGNVTLFGESGGAIAVCGQLTSPGAAGLFHRAILQSGACGTVIRAGGSGPGAQLVDFWRDRAATWAQARTTAATLGCTGADAALLACLRGLPAERMVAQTGDFGQAVFGGQTLPQSPVRALAGGDAYRVPVLSGYNRNEAMMFAGLFQLMGQPITEENLVPRLELGFGEHTPAVLAEYPAAEFPIAAERWAAPYTDSAFACPHVTANGQLRGPVYGYEFADETAPPVIPVVGGIRSGGSHGAELYYLFDSATHPMDAGGTKIALTERQRAVAAEMVTAWVTFARTGRPPVGWPRWSDTGQSRLITAEPGGAETTDPLATHHCRFWR